MQKNRAGGLRGISIYPSGQRKTRWCSQVSMSLSKAVLGQRRGSAIITPNGFPGAANGKGLYFSSSAEVDQDIGALPIGFNPGVAPFIVCRAFWSSSTLIYFSGHPNSLSYSPRGFFTRDHKKASSLKPWEIAAISALGVRRDLQSSSSEPLYILP